MKNIAFLTTLEFINPFGFFADSSENFNQELDQQIYSLFLNWCDAKIKQILS